MFARVVSASIMGVEGFIVEVEIDLTPGVPAFSIVGLPDSAVRESKERVLSALKNSGLGLIRQKITVNLAPADVRKEGSAFDLPIAVGMLAAAGVIPPDGYLADHLIVGELSLDGGLRRVKGVLPMALTAKRMGYKGIILPSGNGAEAAIVDGIDVYPVENLIQAVNFLIGNEVVEPLKVDRESIFERASSYMVDFSEVKGQEHAKRALEVAAAGGHNVLMIGPPGSGKTMLARRIPTILPRMTLDEALETTKIHSVAGLIPEGIGLVATRPFRSPHHTISDAGLIGGGAVPRPGEVSLAHNGVLFLDELPEFNRNVLEVLRQPLEDGVVTISRAKTSVTYPARFMLVAAMNPCPCGYLTDPYHECTCTPAQIQRYHSKISGPLLDRIDIHIEVPALRYEELRKKTSGEPSESIRQRVQRAREVQLKRFAGRKGIYFNAHMGAREIKEFCQIGGESEMLLKSAIERFGFSARAYHRILKVARTIADLENSENIQPHHIAEAIEYRALDKSDWFTAPKVLRDAL